MEWIIATVVVIMWIGTLIWVAGQAYDAGVAEQREEDLRYFHQYDERRRDRDCREHFWKDK